MRNDMLIYFILGITLIYFVTVTSIYLRAMYILNFESRPFWNGVRATISI
jgi:hypothetical protein